jgi:ABC-type branched-subunit amino acid transport system substrate-binding protein
MKRVTWGFTVLVAIAALVWIAAPAVSQPKVVKIGDLGSKVGVFEGYGKYQTWGMQMAVEELNAKGGVLGTRSRSSPRTTRRSPRRPCARPRSSSFRTT